jgi:hypothetical protein
MKIFSAIAVGAAFMLTSCLLENEMGPSPEDHGAYIDASIHGATFNVGTENPTFTIPIHHSQAVENITVTLQYESANMDLFDPLPSTITIPAGGDTFNLNVTAVLDAMEFNVPYEFTITIAGESDVHTNYGHNFATFNVLKALVWGTPGIAKYNATAWAANYGEGEWYVRYQKAVGLEFYRLINAYVPLGEIDGFPTGVESIWEEEIINPGVDHYLIIDATDPNAVKLAEQGLGFDWGTGEFKIGAVNNRIDSYPLGRMQGNIISIICYIDPGDGRTLGNGQADLIEFDIQQPVIPDAPADDSEDGLTWDAAGTTYFSSAFLQAFLEEDSIVSTIASVERAESTNYTDTPFRIVGPYTTLMPDNSFEGAYNLDFTFDVTSQEPVAVPDQALGIYLPLNATTLLPAYIENATIEREGLHTFHITGDFYILQPEVPAQGDDPAIPAVKHNMGNFTEIMFWYEQPDIFLTWTSLGTGTFVDGVLATYYVDPNGVQTPPYNAAEWTWTVEVEQADQKPDFYRIKNAYDFAADRGNCATLYDEYYMVIDTTGGEVFIEEQSSGMHAGDGEIIIMSATYFQGNFSLGTFSNGVIDFGDMALVDDTGAYLIGFPMTLTLPTGPSPSPVGMPGNSNWKPYKVTTNFGQRIDADRGQMDQVRNLYEKVIARDAKPTPATARKSATRKVNTTANHILF